MRLEQQGTFRMAVGKPWLPFRAHQAISAERCHFVWRAQIRMAPLLSVRVEDAYEEGRGRLRARVLGILPVASASGASTDAGELLRYLAELPWCPFAYRQNPALDLEPIDDKRVRVSCSTDQGVESLELTANAAGDVIGVDAPTRPMQTGKTSVRTPWRGTYWDHALWDGVRIPRKASVSWLLDEGPFEYFRGEITKFETIS